MKIDQLQYFIETAKHQHIGKASKILHISPSAISHSISALERELGRELFQKKGKNIFLTSYGRLLLERGERLLFQVQQLKDDLSSDEIEFLGHYRLAATHMICEQVITPIWSKFKKKFPKLTAEIFTLRSVQVYRQVIDGECDIGVCFSPQPHPELHERTLHEGNLYIYVRKGHPILKVSKDDLVKEINTTSASLPKAFEGIDVCVTHPVFKKNKIKPNVEMMFDSYAVCIDYLLKSDAWGFLPEWAAESYGKKLERLEVNKDLSLIHI